MTPSQAAAADGRARLRGIVFNCLGVLMFSALDTAAKYAGRHVPTLEVVWVRYAGSLVVTVLVLQPWRHPAAYRTRRPLLQLFRGLALLGSTLLNFTAIAYLQLAETVAISFAGPLLVTALSGPVLGEWAGPRRWAAVVVGFLGVLIVVNPGPESFQPAILLSIGSTCCYAAYLLTTRILADGDTDAAMLLYASLVGAVFLTPAMPAVAAAPPDWTVAGALLVTAVAATIGHWFVIAAHRAAPPLVVAPFQYTQLVWMVGFGWLAFGDLPRGHVLIGAAFIIASGLYTLYREAARRRGG